MAIAVNASGWSEPVSIDTNYDKDNAQYWNEDKYTPITPGTQWYMDDYWTRWQWARKYTNLSTMTQKLMLVSFEATVGHSGGGVFYSNNGNDHIAYGSGCTFFARVFYVGNRNYIESSGAVLNPISSCNAMNGDTFGVGNGGFVRFGNPNYFTGDMAIRTHVLSFGEQGVIIEPGQSILIVLDTKNWTMPQKDNGVIAVLSSGGQMGGKIEPEESDYIWVYKANEGWVKERVAFMYNGSDWNRIE